MSGSGGYAQALVYFFGQGRADGTASMRDLLGGKGIWKPATTGFTPGNESAFMQAYLQGEFARVNGAKNG